MRIILLLLASVPAFGLFAQPFAIGNRSITFYDAVRDRDVATNLYYPAGNSGADVPVADGFFPVLVFGHGFVMTPNAYGNIWQYFVPKGYIVALPTTEGGFAPDHANFGADLAFLATALQIANTETGSPFEGRVAPATALMGHSMGGGASFLGAGGNENIQALVNLAPAETNPSSTAAAGSVTVPTLVFAASEDCVTPIPDHQGPMYAATAANCKAFVNILGGGHCYFANDNFNCSFGEFTCGPDLTISRADQHDVVNDFAGLWLDHHLKGVPGAFDAFRDSAAVSTRVQAQVDCISTQVTAPMDAGHTLFPVPVDQRLHISVNEAVIGGRLLDLDGREVRNLGTWIGTLAVDVSALSVGSYFVELIHRDGTHTTDRFVVAR
jgi:predicted dienelactone hydrolase